MKFYAGAAILAVVAGVGLPLVATMFRTLGDPFDPCRPTAVAGGSGSIGGPFTLVSETGETVTDKDVITEPTLVYFGYTFCPDVCPLDTVRNADAVEILSARGYEVTPVFISVDPARDTPDVMKDFTANIHPKMLGLTGSPEQIAAAAKAYAAYYRAHEAEDEFYLVDHSTFTYLVLPEAGFVEFFRRDISEDVLAERVSCFLDAA